MTRHYWSASDLSEIRRCYPYELTATIAVRLARSRTAVYLEAKKLGLRKSPEFLRSPASGRIQAGSTVGISGRFLPGHPPANKGLRRPGYAPGRMAQTQFKKGILSGRNAKRYAPIGTERLSKDGYRERKITHEGRGGQRWKSVHALLWIEHYGPIPDGYAIAFIDGDKTYVEIRNLVMMSRVDLMRRNSYHNNYPKEIGQLIQLRGAIVRQINRRQRIEKQDTGSA